MQIVALISCTKSKRNGTYPAYQLYDASSLFVKEYKYANSFTKDIFILSAKHGLLKDSEHVSSYNETLITKSDSERKVWASSVIYKLKEVYDFNSTKFIILAGKNYYEYLIPYLIHYEIIGEGLRLGEKQKELIRLLNVKDEYDSKNSTGVNVSDLPIKNLSYELHRIFNSIPRLFPKDISHLNFDNGIYVVFQSNERYHDMDRIVRVGTHTANGRLKKRLEDHFVKQNKDGSIFRKNIGKALLNKVNDYYLDMWAIDTSDKKKTIEIHHEKYDIEKQKSVEESVTCFLSNNMSFVCFKVDNKQDRLRLEEGIIATLNNDKDFHASPNWLGNYSPIADIRNSALWLVQGLKGKELIYEEFSKVKAIINGEIINANISSEVNSNKMKNNESKLKSQNNGMGNETNIINKHKTCRNALLECAMQLVERKGINEFSIKELLDQMNSDGTSYKESTIRTHITSKCCYNAPKHHAKTYDDFELIRKGVYQLRNYR